jgi:hypothetical protein
MSETGVGASTTAKGACLYDEMGNCIAAAATSRRVRGRPNFCPALPTALSMAPTGFRIHV